MASLATFFRRSDFSAAVAPERDRVQQERALRIEADPYRLRALPNDDVYFYCKHVDNSRLVRQADPKAKNDCWSAIGAACVIAVLCGTIITPRVGGLMAGYKLEALKQEHRELLDKSRSLDIDEARLLNPARLEELAQLHKLAGPVAGQIFHLEPKRTDRSMAFNVSDTAGRGATQLR